MPFGILISMLESWNTVLLRCKTYTLVCFDLINDLRLHVIFNYFLVVSWFLYASGLSAPRAVSYAALMACLAGFSYLLNRYTDYSYDVIADRGLAKASPKLYLVLSASFFVCSLILVYLYPQYLYPIILGTCLGVFYSVKTIFKYPLKNYFITKNLFAAFSKYLGTMIGVLLVIPFSEGLLIRSISMFAFHLIYEILWDIRDIESDKAGNVSTIPNRYGKTLALIICVLIWLISFQAQYFAVNHSEYFFIKYAVVLSIILSLIFVKTVRWYHVAIYIHIALSLTFINKEVILYIQSLW